MARTLNDIGAKRPLSHDARKRVDDIKRAMQLEIALAELRELRGPSQTQVAACGEPQHRASAKDALGLRLVTMEEIT